MLVLRRRSEERRCVECDVGLSVPGGPTCPHFRCADVARGERDGEAMLSRGAGRSLGKACERRLRKAGMPASPSAQAASLNWRKPCTRGASRRRTISNAVAFCSGWTTNSGSSTNSCTDLGVPIRKTGKYRPAGAKDAICGQPEGATPQELRRHETGRAIEGQLGPVPRA
jgi:hypothetical protein